VHEEGNQLLMIAIVLHALETLASRAAGFDYLDYPIAAIQLASLPQRPT